MQLVAHYGAVVNVNHTGAQRMKLSELKSAISQARDEAVAAARREYRRGYFASRGTFLATIDKNGQCEPRPEAECPTWDGTKRDIDELIALVQKDYPNVTQVYLSGGYDWAESVRSRSDGDYHPWAASWSVTLWKRDEA